MSTTTIAQLEKELAGMLDQLDIPKTWTGRQVNDYETRRAVLSGRIHTIRTSTQALAQITPSIAADEQWLGDLTTWRKTLETELKAMPLTRDEKQVAVQQNHVTCIRIIEFGLRCDGEYTRSMETLRLGDLMRASGYVQAPPQAGTSQVFGPLPWYGSHADVKHRLEDLRIERDEMQARLDNALLSDADREAAAKAEKARIDALNAKPVRKTRADGTQYDRYQDGRRVEVPDAEVEAARKAGAAAKQVTNA